MPSAPAAITLPALLSSMPAMAPTGICGARARTIAASFAKPSGRTGGSLLSFEEVWNTPPMQT